LRGSVPSGHAVQIYSHRSELVDSVTSYLAAGFEAGEPAVVVARPENVVLFREGLAALGWDEQKRDGLLVVADAEETLASILRDEQPSAEAFDEVIGELLDGIAQRSANGRPRVFGEMVDILCERGLPQAAGALEESWNHALSQRRFSLLCAYRVDIFDRATQVGTMRDVCRSHSHILPAYDTERLSQAVDLALEEILGYEEAGKVYFLVGDEARDERVPVAELALMWVSENMPLLADRVLASARARYACGPVPART
jgi:MEDS: MEthanogen/methylotroph, DcmR Sensory domain